MSHKILLSALALPSVAMDASYSHFDGRGLNHVGATSPQDEQMVGDFGDDSLYEDRAFEQAQRHDSINSMHQSQMDSPQFSQHPSNSQRRPSMHDFDGMSRSGMGGNLQNFQSNPNAAAQTIMIPGMIQTEHDGQPRPMNLVTQYINGTGQPFQTMVSPVQGSFGEGSPVNMNHLNMQQAMMMGMPMGNSNDMMGQGMSHFAPNNHMMPSVMLQVPNLRMNHPQANSSPNPSTSAADNMHQQASPIHASSMRSTPQDQMSSMSLNTPTHLRPHASFRSEGSMPTPMSSPLKQADNSNVAKHIPATSRSQFPLRPDQQDFLVQNPNPNQQLNMNTRTVRASPTDENYLNAYSSTGFDMLNVLMRVATRPNPDIHLGAVDLSCAFVVCDALEHDFPIMYCSENFERLTGYTKHEILGRNCRFLQAPDGKVRAGVKRPYVDDESVLYLKNRITERKEAQVSLINYRKGGQPFMNLLTMIPVFKEDGEVRYFVGFQVDLVEQPNSVTNKNKGKCRSVPGASRAACTDSLDQMGRTQSTTNAACTCLVTCIKVRKTCPRWTPARRYRAMMCRRCWPRLGPASRTSPDASGTRCCWKTPTTWSLCSRSKDSSSTSRPRANGSWNMNRSNWWGRRSRRCAIRVTLCP